MDPQLAVEIGALAKLSERRIYHVLGSETPRRYDLTKALVDVLFNLCVVESIETGDEQKKIFEKNLKIVRKLVSKKTSLKTKKKILLDNVPVVLALAETCLLNA